MNAIAPACRETNEPEALRADQGRPHGPGRAAVLPASVAADDVQGAPVAGDDGWLAR